MSDTLKLTGKMKVIPFNPATGEVVAPIVSKDPKELVSEAVRMLGKLVAAHERFDETGEFTDMDELAIEADLSYSRELLAIIEGQSILERLAQAIKHREEALRVATGRLEQAMIALQYSSRKNDRELANFIRADLATIERGVK